MTHLPKQTLIPPTSANVNTYHTNYHNLLHCKRTRTFSTVHSANIQRGLKANCANYTYKCLYRWNNQIVHVATFQTCSSATLAPNRLSCHRLVKSRACPDHTYYTIYTASPKVNCRVFLAQAWVRTLALWTILSVCWWLASSACCWIWYSVGDTILLQVLLEYCHQHGS